MCTWLNCTHVNFHYGFLLHSWGLMTSYNILSLAQFPISKCQQPWTFPKHTMCTCPLANITSHSQHHLPTYLFTYPPTYIHYQKFWVLQLSFTTKLQLHATHATTNLCSCIRQVAHDIQLHATLRMQHVYTMLIQMFIHTYKSKCSCILCATLLVTTMHLIKI